MAQISAKVDVLVQKLKAMGISVKYDDSDTRKPGWKFAEYELKGVPVRLAIGARDLENGTVEVARRDTLTKETRDWDGVENISRICWTRFRKIFSRRRSTIVRATSTRWIPMMSLREQIEKGGFILAHWDGTAETEAKIGGNQGYYPLCSVRELPRWR